MKKIIVLIVVLAVCAALAATVPAVLAAAGLAPPPHTSVIVCHSTGSLSNPYTKVTVAVHSVDDANGLNGHGDDPLDAWLSFTFDGVTYDGQNEALFGTLIDSDCNELVPATATATSTETPTNTPIPTDTPVPTDTPIPTATDTATATATDTPTLEPTATDTATATATPDCNLLDLILGCETATPTNTSEPTATDTATLEPTATETPGQDTATPSETPVPTDTTVPTATSVDQATPTTDPCEGDACVTTTSTPPSWDKSWCKRVMIWKKACIEGSGDEVYARALWNLMALQSHHAAKVKAPLSAGDL